MKSELRKVLTGYYFSKHPVLNLLLLLGTVTFSLLLSLWVFRESPRTLFSNTIPLNGDGALIGLFLKVAINNSYSSILQSDITTTSLGWPGNLDFSDFPVGQLGELLVIKLFSQVSGITEPGILIHIFSILKVIPISIAVILLGRTIKLNPLITSSIAIAYSVSTYNLIRSEGHFFLGLTWTIPLGLAAIFLAFSVSRNLQTERNRTPTKLLKIFILILPVALGTFYYSFFICLLALSAFLILAIKYFTEELHASNHWSLRKKFYELTSRLSGFILIGATILFGVLFQLGIYISRGEKIALTGLADRSPIESVIYGGTFEGYFFDSSQLMLNLLKRQDLLNFAASRVSWEGAQLGAFAGFATYTFLLLCFYFIVKPKIVKAFVAKKSNGSELSANFWLAAVLLFVSLSLYFVGPLNFGISRVFPEIRAWGRMSSVLTLVILITVALAIELYFRKIGVKAIVLILVMAIPITEAYFFRSYRPNSTVASNLANSTNIQREESLKELRMIYKEDCPLFLAPVYPFPEYERSDDNNFDYSQLALPLVDDGYFRWSAGSIKSTGNSRAWQNLASVQPNFVRTSIQYQLDYARALGACGSVADISLFIPSERKEFSNILDLSEKSCVKWLPGEEFEGRPRFVSIRFSGNDCRINIEDSLKNFARSNLQSDIIWQVDQPYGLNYINEWQMFSNLTAINFRLVTSDNPDNKDVSISLKVIWLTDSVKTSSINVCLRAQNSDNKECQDLTLDSNRLARLPINSKYLTDSITKLELSLSPESINSISQWGFVIVQDE
jgi:hypothetical protein